MWAKDTETTAMRLSYIGEPVTAAGFALIGANTHTPQPEASIVWPLVLKLRAHTDLLLLNRAHAESVASQLTQLLHKEPLPPVFILPGMNQEEQPVLETTKTARRILGLANATFNRTAED